MPKLISPTFSRKEWTFMIVLTSPLNTLRQAILVRYLFYASGTDLDFGGMQPPWSFGTSYIGLGICTHFLWRIQARPAFKDHAQLIRWTRLLGSQEDQFTAWFRQKFILRALVEGASWGFLALTVSKQGVLGVVANQGQVLWESDY